MAASPILHCEQLARGALPRANNSLELSGLILDPNTSEVAVELAGTRATPTLTEPSVATLRVANGHRIKRFEVSVRTADLSPGRHRLILTATCDDGRREALEAEVDVLPYEPAPPGLEDLATRVQAGRGAMWCESLPTEGPVWPVLELRGWAAGRAGVSAVTVMLDRRHRFELGTVVSRPDVARALGIEGLDRCGFLAELDVRGQQPGEHHLAVVARFDDGTAMGQEGTVAFGMAPAWSADPVRVDGDDPPPILGAPPMRAVELPDVNAGGTPSETEIALHERLARAVAEGQADRIVASLERAGRRRAEDLLEQAISASESSERQLASILGSRSWKLASLLRRTRAD